MGLSKKKRKFVLQNAHLTPEELADKLGAGVNDIKEFVKERVSILQPEKLETFWQIIRANWKFLLFVLVLTTAVYANGLNANFVSDDYATLNQNVDIGKIEFLKSDFNLINMQYFIFFHFFGNQNPLPYRLYSLFLYLFVLILSYVFLYLLTKSKEVSSLAIFLYCLMPIHVEAVTWISGKPYLYLAVTALIMMISYHYFESTRKKKYLIYILIAAFVHLETIKFWLLVPIPLYLLFRYAMGDLDKLIKKINFTYVWLMLISLIILFVYYFPFIKNRVSLVNAGAVNSFYNPLEQYPSSVSKYLQLSIFPIDLTLYHTLFANPVWLNWLIFVLYLVCVVYFFRTNRLLFFALVFIFIASIIAMSPIRVSWLVAERYLFFGSLGVALFVGILFYKLNNKLPVLGYLLIFLISVVSIYRIYKRNIDWQTNHNLWVNTCQVSPNSHNAWNNIGDDYDKLAQYENAIKGFTQSTVVKPDYADAFHNRANIFYKMGRLDLAKDSYLTAIKLNQGLFQSYLSLAQVTYTEKDYNLTGLILDRLLSLNPSNIQGLYMKAVVELSFGRKDNAINLAQTVLNLSPSFSPALDLLKQIK